MSIFSWPELKSDFYFSTDCCEENATYNSCGYPWMRLIRRNYLHERMIHFTANIEEFPNLIAAIVIYELQFSLNYWYKDCGWANEQTFLFLQLMGLNMLSIPPNFQFHYMVKWNLLRVLLCFQLQMSLVFSSLIKWAVVDCWSKCAAAGMMMIVSFLFNF